jgi:hypothetical protein
MATYQDIITEIRNTPGVFIVRQKEDSATVVGGDVVLNTKTYIITYIIRLKKGASMKNVSIFVANPGTAQEVAELAEPIPEVFRSEVETFVSTLGGTRFTITEIDEVDEWAAVTVLFDNGLTGIQREITSQPFIVFKDNGTMMFAKDMRTA